MKVADSRLDRPVALAQHDWPEGTTPLVSILLMTYNHETFVGKAIEGCLSQESTFPVEIIVHDDASTDATAGIVAEYAAAHPRLFRFIAQSENQHSRGRRAMQITMDMAQGEFVAFCEGDDYWTAPAKLESQIALLENRPDASGCIHRADGRFEESGTVVSGLFGPSVVKSQYDIDDLMSRENFVPTVSILLRRRACNFPGWLASVPHGDMPILCNAALAGPILYIDRSMAVYRKHGGGLHTRDATAIQALKCVQTLIAIGANFGVANRESFQSGLRFRMGEIKEEVERYEATISDLERRHQSDLRNMQTIMKSKTFKVGRALSGLRDRLRGRRLAADRSTSAR